jgi:hypothetical protein
VIEDIGVHALDEAGFIGNLSMVGQQVADLRSGLSDSPEFVMCAQQLFIPL